MTTMDLPFHMMCATIQLVIFLSVSSAMSNASSSPPRKRLQLSQEKKLIRKLMNNYAKIGLVGRPVRNVSTSVPVHFGLGLIQMNLDEKNKILSMSMWTRYMWRDEYLMWDPDDYNGVSQIKLAHHEIWSPDIMLYNTADVLIEQREALAMVHSNGNVFWFPHSIFKATCSVDVTNFPFDEQQCHMAFGSWTHNSQEIDLHMGFPGGIDLSTFQSDHKESSAWDVLNVTARKEYMPEGEEPNFAVLTFTLMMKRKLVFSSYILTLPCVFLASLTLVVFWLPPERPDRTALAMAVFSTFMLLLLILVEEAPNTAGSIPTIGVYYCFNMVIIVMSVVLSSLVVNVGKGKVGKRPPRWLVMVTLRCLARLMCIKVEFVDNSCACRKRKRQKDCEENQNGECVRMLCGTTDCVSAFRKRNSGSDSHSRSQYQDNLNSTTSIESVSLLHNEVTAIKQSLSRMEIKLEEKTATASFLRMAANEWKECAMVLDRFFFVLYLALIAVSLTLFFPRPQENPFA